jgi:trichohyalin
MALEEGRMREERIREKRAQEKEERVRDERRQKQDRLREEEHVREEKRTREEDYQKKQRLRAEKLQEILDRRENNRCAEAVRVAQLARRKESERTMAIRKTRDAECLATITSEAVKKYAKIKYGYTRRSKEDRYIRKNMKRHGIRWVPDLSLKRKRVDDNGAALVPANGTII